MQRLDDIVASVLERAIGAGADAADAVAVESDSESVGVRCGTVERVSEAHQKRVGLRVFVGQSSAVVSSADLSADSLARLAADAVALARVTAPDPHAGLPDPADIVGNAPDLDLYDARAEDISTAQKIALATEAEAAAFQADPAISKGTKSQQFLAGTGVPGGIVSDAVEHPRLVAGALAIFSAYLKAASGTPTARLKIEAFDSSDVSLGSNTASPTLSPTASKRDCSGRSRLSATASHRDSTSASRGISSTPSERISGVRPMTNHTASDPAIRKASGSAMSAIRICSPLNWKNWRKNGSFTS